MVQRNRRYLALQSIDQTVEVWAEHWAEPFTLLHLREHCLLAEIRFDIMKNIDLLKKSSQLIITVPLA